MRVITDERCTGYSAVGHPERPARVAKTLELLRTQTELPVTWGEPEAAPDEAILRAHTPELLARVKAAAEAFDGDTPAHEGIHDHARRSVGGALAALAAEIGRAHV